MKHVVILTIPGEKPRHFELKGKRIGIGREVDNDIQLPVESVSSSHLEFRKTEEGYELEDLNSTNGTRVNGEVIEKVLLNDGDRILIGETVPAHFVALEEGETYESSTADGSEEEQAAAAEYASMSDRLEELEADIEAKQVEAAQLEVRLAELRNDFAAKQVEYQQAQAELETLQAEINSRTQAGGSGGEEMAALEKDLMQQTKKVKLMATDLAEQQQTIANLESQAEAGPVAPAARGPVMPRPPAGGTVRKPVAPGAKTVMLKKRPPKLSGVPRVPKKKVPRR